MPYVDVGKGQNLLMPHSTTCANHQPARVVEIGPSPESAINSALERLDVRAGSGDFVHGLRPLDRFYGGRGSRPHDAPQRLDDFALVLG